MSRLLLRRSKAGPAWAGHPWIFASALAGGPDPAPAAWVEVCDGSSKTLGWGLFSPNSQIRVRIVTWGLEPPAGADSGIEAELPFWCALLRRAMTRRGLRPDVRPTEARRLVNAEGDGLPGLTIDLFGAVAVVQISTLPMAHRRSVLMQAIQDVFRPDTVLMADPERAGELEGFEAQRGWWGPEPSSPTSFVDGGLNYLLDFRALQKTGHYLDVREHRKWVADRVAARSIFDGYCFTGGFSLAAAAAGATRALGVDSSESAIELATQNARVMGLSDRVEFVRSDVFDKLRSCADLKQTFNFVVLDPPKFAPRARDRNKATEAYGALAREGLRVLAPGGILGLSSCSHHVGEDDLVRAIAAASARRGRSLDVVHVGSHDGDHPYPAAMSEGRYLTFVFCQERCG